MHVVALGHVSARAAAAKVVAFAGKVQQPSARAGVLNVHDLVLECKSRAVAGGSCAVCRGVGGAARGARVR